MNPNLSPIHAEFTTQEAAELLNVSQLFLIEQIEAGKILDRKVGKQRRIRFNDLMAYTERCLARCVSSASNNSNFQSKMDRSNS
jgi:excisionase family DNA binding protein